MNTFQNIIRPSIWRIISWDKKLQPLRTTPIKTFSRRSCLFINGELTPISTLTYPVLSSKMRHCNNNSNFSPSSFLSNRKNNILNCINSNKNWTTYPFLIKNKLSSFSIITLVFNHLKNHLLLRKVSLPFIRSSQVSSKSKGCFSLL